nr:retrotransposon Orf1 [Tanacetum cinerariifolium]
MGTHDDEAGSSRSKCSKNMKPWKRLRKSGSDEKIFTSVAWIRAFNINEPIYVELCHEFYSTYEFDEVCADDELQTKKIIKFRLGGRAHNLPFLEFARRLGLYQAVELEEEGFNVYFKGGLRSDEHFNAQDYWLGISREENLGLSQCQDAVRSLSALIYYRDLDTITLRDLIDCDGKLIPEDPQPGVPRVGIPRPPRASMKDLYDRIGRIEICQEAIEGMEYRQSYHWDRYQGVFKYMAGVYSVPLQGAYNAPGTKYFRFDCLRASNKLSSTVVQKSGIQCFNCKEFRHVAMECQKPKQAKDAAYHKKKMLLCKQEEAEIQLNAEQTNWRDDTDDDELEDQELEAHYIEEIDQNDDDNDLATERELLASLIEKLK